MYKLIALIGVVAGGATYGLYQTGYLGCDECSAPRKSCCTDSAKPKPADCCVNQEPCCETQEACCGEKIAAAKPSCCAEGGVCKTEFATAKVVKAPCCANPCPACAGGCDGCPICEIDCAGCCGLSANAAVAGPAAAFVAKPKK